MSDVVLLEDADISLLLDIANMACHRGFPAEARSIVDGVLAIKPDFPPALISLAFSHLIVDAFDEALAILDPVLEKNPKDNDAIIMKGMTLLLNKKISEAKELFDSIPENAPQKSIAKDLLASL